MKTKNLTTKPKQPAELRSSDLLDGGKRECPHCHGSLERYEDPKAVEIIAKLEYDIKNLHSTLRRAIEIIKLHVPDDALGINSNCGEPVAQTWPIKDEELYYMEQAIGLTGGEI